MAGFWDSEELIGALTKNSREEIHIKKVTKNAREFIDIRTFWFDPGEDTFKPSQKGVAIPYEYKETLLEFLGKA
jgi:hypothetical protein